MARQQNAAIIKVVADNVRFLRKEAELSQEELAHEAGVDRTYISQVERRQRNITITVLAGIAKALQVAPERLLSPNLAGNRKRT